MDSHWTDSQPIYRQLRDRVVAMMLEGVLKEGEPLPSVRQVAAEYRLNPLTVLKSYQQLVDEGLVEKRRGLGMFVAPGASKALMKDERARFLETDWPKIRATIQRLGLSADWAHRIGDHDPERRRLLSVARTVAGTPAAGANQALRLITESKVHALIGAYQSGITVTTSAMAEAVSWPCRLASRRSFSMVRR